MSIYNLVELTLNALRQRLDNDGRLKIQAEFGYCEMAKCSFNPPTTAKEIDNFFSAYNLKVPYDYKQFLLLHNGARLFVSPGGGFELFGLDEIYKLYIEYDYINIIPEGWFPIGTDNGDMLFINSTKYTNSRECGYLFWTEMLFVDDALELDLSFERWLEKFIITNGVQFWNWKSETTHRYYRNLKSYLANLKEYHKQEYKFEFEE